jgi:DNA-binding CsgD family transcriptional regulator
VTTGASAAQADGASLAAARLGADLGDALAEIGVPAFIVCSAGVIRWLNAKAEELVGDARGRQFASVLAPESVLSARLEFAKKLVGSARVSALPLVLRSPDDKRSSVSVHTAVLTDGDRVVGVFGMIELVSADTPPPLDETLTPRQHQVLLALSRGASTYEIAASLGIATETARNHVRRLLRSLGVHSRLEAVAEARRRGLISL